MCENGFNEKKKFFFFFLIVKCLMKPATYIDQSKYDAEKERHRSGSITLFV